jgi:hypothetical protein
MPKRGKSGESPLRFSISGSFLNWIENRRNTLKVSLRRDAGGKEFYTESGKLKRKSFTTERETGDTGFPFYREEKA